MKIIWVVFYVCTWLAPVSLCAEEQKSSLPGPKGPRVIVNFWAPYDPSPSVWGVQLVRSFDRTWIRGYVKVLEENKLGTRFQFVIDSKKTNGIDVKGLIPYQLSDTSACALPYRISIKKIDRFSYELSEFVPATVPVSFEEFQRQAGEFNLYERLLVSPVYLLPAGHHADIAGKFSATGLTLNNTHSISIPLKASDTAAIGKIAISFALKTQNIVGGQMLLPQVEAATLVTPSGWKIDLDSLTFNPDNRTLNSSESYVSSVMVTNLNKFLESSESVNVITTPAKGEWKLMLKIKERRPNTVVNYTADVEGSLVVTPLLESPH